MQASEARKSAYLDKNSFNGGLSKGLSGVQSVAHGYRS